LDRITVAIVSFVITLLMTPVAIKIAKKYGWIDLPNERKIHKIPMPRVGGIGIFFGIIIGIIVAGFFSKETWPFWALIPLSIVSIMGFIDDVKGLSFKIKFLFQIVSAVLAIILTNANVLYINNPFGGQIKLGILGPVFAVLWIVGVTNAVNLTDGLDGLAAGISAIAAITIAITSAKTDLPATLVAIAIFASAVAFLRYNFHPAKTFMGDTGSQLLGFALALVSIKGSSLSASTLSLAVPLLAIGVPILDTGYAVIRRTLGGHNPFLPDKMHIHHQLLSIGFSHVTAVLFMYAVSIVFAVIAISYKGLHDLTALAFYIIIGAVLLSFLWVMRKRSEKNGRNYKSKDSQIGSSH
jgi:UDP-GlcNAc:undecaprenyl-phosphate GlcNAc-1-phosphate transferase